MTAHPRASAECVGIRGAKTRHCRTRKPEHFSRRAASEECEIPKRHIAWLSGDGEGVSHMDPVEIIADANCIGDAVEGITGLPRHA